jgi:uncharacterized membrane-anchored protein YhcB (DUF1043 family)
MMPSTEWLWGIGIVILGLAVGYALMRNRSRTAQDKLRTEAGTAANYRAEQREEDGRPQPRRTRPADAGVSA